MAGREWSCISSCSTRAGSGEAVSGKAVGERCLPVRGGGRGVRSRRRARPGARSDRTMEGAAPPQRAKTGHAGDPGFAPAFFNAAKSSRLRNGKHSATAEKPKLLAEESPELVSECRLIACQAFPNHEHLPALRAKRSYVPSVSGGISFALLVPISGVRGRPDPSVTAAMFVPETAVDENHFPVRNKDNVGLA